MMQKCIYSCPNINNPRDPVPMKRFLNLPASLLAVIASLLFQMASPQPAAADSASADTDAAEPVDLEPLVVVASRLPQPLSSVAAQVTVIDAADIRRALTEDFDGLLKYEPGLDLQTSGTRFGSNSVNIRGIDGNRVYIEVDGVPLRNQFSIGAYSNADRLTVETDRIKRVEVLHGPASVMHGSNALGGVMAITTWDPTDLLMRSGSNRWLGLRAGYQGMDASYVGSGVAALVAGSHGFLAAASYREGHELDNQAPADVPNDPQDWNSSDYLFRYTWDTPAGNRLRLSAASWEREVATDVRSLLGYGSRFRRTTSLRGDDRDESRRVSLDYDFATASGFQGRLQAFSTSADTDHWSFEERNVAPRPVAIDRRFQYAQDQDGFKGFVSREATWAHGSHQWAAGAEWRRHDIEELRDGLQTNLLDGSTTNVVLGETMPVRDFPVSRTRETGLWLQDAIDLAGGRWQITPALRWDRYDLDPRPDDTWREDNPETEVVPISEDRVTPRLGVLFRAGELWSIYGQYAEGFRAPPFEDANIGFDIPLFGFRAVPNPDLRSETSRGYELGLRRFSPASRLSIALFYTDYDDLIESRVLIGRDPVSGDLLFQSRNIEQARIHGVDLRYELDLAAWHDRLEAWSLQLAAYWAEGENRQTAAPLNSIAPPQAVIGLTWASADERWELAGSATLTAAKDESDIDHEGDSRFAAPSWATLDLTLGWRPAERLELRAGVFNLADETYWRWLDVANLEASNPMIPLLSRPGRSFSASLRISF